MHDCTGRSRIGWKRGEVVPGTDHTCYARCPMQQQTHFATIPTGVLFPQVLNPTVAHLGLGLGTGTGGWGWGWCSIPKLHIWGWGWGWGRGWVLLGPMGLWCPGRCQKLYGLVRKPLAALPSAATEPLRHASNKQGAGVAGILHTNVPPSRQRIRAQANTRPRLSACGTEGKCQGHPNREAPENTYFEQPRGGCSSVDYYTPETSPRFTRHYVIVRPSRWEGYNGA